jgi:N-acetylglucosaminyl-diphospho-decaprenol L-rhamnosyltransferase
MSSNATVISVAHNSNDVLPEMLESIPVGTQIFVVDNATRDLEGLRAICAKFNATLIENGENKGFGYACNRGAERATTEFLFFLNPDATLKPDTIGQLAAAMGRYPKASAMNPRIALANGAAQFHYRSRLMPVSEYMPRRWPDQDAEVTVLMGSAMFVRRSEFEAVGGFDENIFLYHEDDDLSRRLRAERGPIMFIRDAFVTHLAEKSSGSSKETFYFKRYHQARSRVYAARKHGRSGPFTIAFIGGILAMLAPDMLYSATRRAKSWGILRGVLSTLRDGGKGRGML